MNTSYPDRQFSRPYRFVILGASLLTVFVAIGLARFGYTMLLPYMAKALSLSKEQGGLIASANLFGYLLMSLAAGFLATRFGARRVIAIALGLTAVALAATALARDFTGALAARFLTGLASGGANVPVMALVSAWFAGRERGLASGLAVGGTSLGLAVSGLVVPQFVSLDRPADWPIAWLFFAVIAAGVFVVALVFLRNRPPAVADAAAPHAQRPRLLAAVPAMLKTRGFAPLALAYFIYGISYIVYATFFSDFLIRERGFPPGTAGDLWFLVGVASVASGFGWGWLSDRIGRARALVIVYALFAVALTLFGLAAGPVPIYVSAVVFALCSWSVPAIMAASAGDLLGGRAPIGFGILTFCFGVGQALGPVLAGAAARALSSYAPVFLMAAMVAALGAGLLLFVRLGPRAKKDDADAGNNSETKRTENKE